MKRSTATGNKTAERLFVDTSGWLVLADSQDPHHQKAVEERRRRIRGNLITTDFVLDETFTRLFARAHFDEASQFSQAILESASTGLLTIERITAARFSAASQMRLKYRYKAGITFTDFTSFVVMQETGVRDVLTGDAHFTQIGLGFRRVL
jgi:predicted nucleic acid-binding protein